MRHDPPGQDTLGADLRALRKSRGLRLADLARASGRSIGWVSQVERDLSQPSVADLRMLAAALDVPLSALFRAEAPEAERGLVVRQGSRRPIGSREDGLTEELLSPDLTDAFEMVHCRFEPGARSAEQKRPTQEVAYIVTGLLDLTVDGRAFRLGPGDSVRIRGEAFRWSNPGPAPCTAIWAIAPPVY